MADEMRAVVFDTFGPPSVLKVVQHPKPKPWNGEVLVKINAAGVRGYLYLTLFSETLFSCGNEHMHKRNW